MRRISESRRCWRRYSDSWLTGTATFAVFLATVTGLVGSERTANPLRPSGPDLSSSQLVVVAGRSPSPGMMIPLTSAEEASLSRRLNRLAVSLHAGYAVPMEHAAGLFEANVPPNDNFTGSFEVATPQLLATYGIKASQIAPHTDILTSRPGLAGLSHLEIIWQNGGNESDNSSQPASSRPRQQQALQAEYRLLG